MCDAYHPEFKFVLFVQIFQTHYIRFNSVGSWQSHMAYYFTSSTGWIIWLDIKTENVQALKYFDADVLPIFIQIVPFEFYDGAIPLSMHIFAFSCTFDFTYESQNIGFVRILKVKPHQCSIHSNIKFWTNGKCSKNNTNDKSTLAIEMLCFCFCCPNFCHIFTVFASFDQIYWSDCNAHMSYIQNGSYEPVFVHRPHTYPYIWNQKLSCHDKFQLKYHWKRCKVAVVVIFQSFTSVFLSTYHFRMFCFETIERK